jgi:broad specificity phosphatase PhoE
MKTTFYLIRHAVKEKAVGDVPITREGRLQAKLTAEHLRNVPIAVIASSPLRRAKETAECIASVTGSVVQEDPRLRERANWGDLPGQTFEEFVAMWERSTRDPDYIPPVGDSAKQAGERLSALLQELGETYPTGSNIAVVTHGGLITDFLARAIPEHELNRWHPDFVAMQSELISECSITRLGYSHGHFAIEDFASVVHLSHEC